VKLRYIKEELFEMGAAFIAGTTTAPLSGHIVAIKVVDPSQINTYTTYFNSSLFNKDFVSKR